MLSKFGSSEPTIFAQKTLKVIAFHDTGVYVCLQATRLVRVLFHIRVLSLFQEWQESGSRPKLCRDMSGQRQGRLLECEGGSADPLLQAPGLHEGGGTFYSKAQSGLRLHAKSGMSP